MEKSDRPWLLAVVLVVVVSGAFIGLAAAHNDGGDSAHEECEMNHDADDCPMHYGPTAIEFCTVLTHFGVTPRTRNAHTHPTSRKG